MSRFGPRRVWRTYSKKPPVAPGNMELDQAGGLKPWRFNMAGDYKRPEPGAEPWREPWPGALGDLKAYIDKNPDAARVLAQFMTRFPGFTRDQAIQMLWDQGILPRA